MKLPDPSKVWSRQKAAFPENRKPPCQQPFKNYHSAQISRTTLTAPSPKARDIDLIEKTLGFTLGQGQVSTATPPDKRRAVFRARRALEDIVHDTIVIEGNPLTLPQVQTLMDGISVGGQRVQDVQQALNQAESWKELLDRIDRGTFQVSQNTMERLHRDVGHKEALEWGRLRTGKVGIPGVAYEPPPARDLERLVPAGTEAINSIGNPHRRAIAAFLWISRTQPFWDGNKRTGRLMMNGILLAEGLDVINVPARRKEEFLTGMARFYDSAQAEK